jgi:hypothetical protein
MRSGQAVGQLRTDVDDPARWYRALFNRRT